MTGSPFQSFYLMFKTNAKEAKKDMLDLQKTSDDTEKKVKKTKEETVELGKAFTDAVEDATRALAAYASFHAIKSGIVNTQEQNRALTIQTSLWKQNANEIAAYGSAVKSAGGDTQALYGWYEQVRQAQAKKGLPAATLGDLMQHIHNQVRGLPAPAQQQIFGAYGISDIGQQSILASSDEDYNKSVKSATELTKNTEAAAKASQEFGKSWDMLTDSLTKFWNTVNNTILPIVSVLTDLLTSAFSAIADSPTGAVAVFVMLTAASVAFSAAIPSIVAGFGSISVAALALAGTLAGIVAPLAGIIAAGYLIPKLAPKGGAWVGRQLNKLLGRGDENGLLPGKEGYSGGGTSSGSAMDYLMKTYGFDSAHAAAIVANMNAESGGNPNAVGDGGSARGLFQWHPDRQAKIKAGLGIDVTSATRDQQLDAAVWELHNRGQYDAFLAQQGAYNAGAYFSQRFEVPKAGLSEAMARGNAALSIAGNTPLASSSFSSDGGGTNVTIGKIDVHTQSTDPDGIARDIIGHMHDQIKTVFAQNNDAVAY